MAEHPAEVGSRNEFLKNGQHGRVTGLFAGVRIQQFISVRKVREV